MKFKLICLLALLVQPLCVKAQTNLQSYVGRNTVYTVGDTMYIGLLPDSLYVYTPQAKEMAINIPFISITDTAIVGIYQSVDNEHWSTANLDTVTSVDANGEDYTLTGVDLRPYTKIKITEAGSDTSIVKSPILRITSP